MGTCRYCGTKAGLFSSQHRACADVHEIGQVQARTLIASSASNVGEIPSQLKLVAQQSYLTQSELKEAAIAGWSQVLDNALDDHVVSQDEQHHLVELLNILPIEQDEIKQSLPYLRFVQALTLRELDDGITPTRFTLDGSIPFNFQKSEQLVWAFQNVDLYEDKTRTTYVGGSRGVSVRIARGVYYRVGAFKGERIPVTETVHTGTGLLAVTTKHIYFSGGRRDFRVPYSKMVSIKAYSDGIGISRDTASAKPMSFVTGDGWFISNLVAKVAAAGS